MTTLGYLYTKYLKITYIFTYREFRLNILKIVILNALF